MTVTELYRYPVKSMLGESLDRCRIDDRGVVGDGLAPEGLIAGTRVRNEETGEAVSRFDLAAMAPQPAFFDLAVLHLLTTATLDRLRELAPGATFDVRRYRPNVVLDADGEGYELFERMRNPVLFCVVSFCGVPGRHAVASDLRVR